MDGGDFWASAVQVERKERALWNSGLMWNLWWSYSNKWVLRYKKCDEELEGRLKARDHWEDGETEETWWRDSVWGGLLWADLVQLFQSVSVLLLGPEQASRSGPGDMMGPHCREVHKSSLFVLLVTTDWRGGVGRCQTYQFCHLSPLFFNFWKLHGQCA